MWMLRTGVRVDHVGQVVRDARRAENEATFPAFGHRVERHVADRVGARMLDELDVVADRAHAAAVERVEQLRVALPAPGPAAFALAAVVLDRTVVDLDRKSTRLNSSH